jgi:ankyrin repeat protein
LEPPLIAACRLHDERIVNLLLTRDDIDVNLCDVFAKLTPLMTAVEEKSVQVMKSLLARNDLNPIIANRHHYILKSSIVLGPSIVKSLLDRLDIDPNLTYIGRTGLMEACIQNATDVVKVFLDREAVDINRQDCSGLTALSLALKNEKLEAAWLENMSI